jgi:hypothetical protein
MRDALQTGSRRTRPDLRPGPAARNSEEAQLQGLLLLPVVRRGTLPPLPKKELPPAQEMNWNPCAPPLERPDSFM